MMDDATEAMFTIDPPPLPSIPGRKARVTRYSAFTFNSTEKSKSFSSQSRIVPA